MGLVAEVGDRSALDALIPLLQARERETETERERYRPTYVHVYTI
jgi:hypothetical protein